MKPSLVFLLFLSGFSVSRGLRCYTCDNEGSGQTCIDNPADVDNGSSECQTPNDEYCYTSRLEQGDGRVIFNRGCCRVKEASSVCPPGDPFQVIVSDNPPYVLKLTRCEGDLCNTDEGEDGGELGSGGAIIVPGKAAAEVKARASAVTVTAFAAVILMSK